MYADTQAIIDIRESRVKNDSPVGADEAVGRSIKFREEAYATLRKTKQALTQSKQRPKGSNVIQWGSGKL